MKNEKADNFYLEIKPPKGLIKFDFKEIWLYKDLFYTFISRNIKVRYKQTAIGVIWAIFQPVLTMLIFTIFFGRLVKVPSENIPYPVFVFAGLLYWNYFSAAVNGASNSLVDSEGIIKKVYFPRLIIPFSSSATPLVDFFFSLIVFFVIAMYYNFFTTIQGVLIIPILLLVAFLSSTGLGLFFASVNVKYRDVRHALPFFIQILLYLTPVIYPVSLIPEKFKWLIFLNPLAGVITVARDTLLHKLPVDWTILGISFFISTLLLILGISYFRKTERYFADII